jgi:DNA-binding response OmpR family regulator
MHFVIIDDEVAVGETLADAIRRQGHTVVVGRSGTEGLALLAEKTPDAVFLDLVMPGLDGLEVLLEIRRISPELPVVVVTGWAKPQDVDQILQFGVTEIIPKPWPLKHLDKALHTLGRIERHPGRTRRARS